MKALSIRQPYAWLIVHGHKDVENRTWHTGYRGPVLIHAGKTYPKRDHEDDFDCYAAQGFPGNRETMLGGIVGIATITGCVTSSTSKWWIGPVGFTLADARPLPQLIPCKGELGFFDVPADVLAMLPPGFLGSAAPHGVTVAGHQTFASPHTHGSPLGGKVLGGGNAF
jgi:hypothetical protein